MAKFAYNNAKNVSINHTAFELNCGYHPRMLYKKEIDSCSKSKLADKLLTKLRELMIVCQNNLHNTQKLQKWAHNKGVIPRSYVSDKKV